MNKRNIYEISIYEDYDCDDNIIYVAKLEEPREFFVAYGNSPSDALTELTFLLKEIE